MGPSPLPQRPLLAVQVSLFCGFVAAASATRMARSSTCVEDMEDSTQTVNGERRGLVQERPALIQKRGGVISATTHVDPEPLGSYKHADKRTRHAVHFPNEAGVSMSDAGAADPDESEPNVLDLAPSAFDRAAEAEPKKVWVDEEEDATASRVATLPKFAGSRVLPPAPPEREPPPYGTYNVPTKEPDTQLVFPVKKALSARALSASAHARLHCIHADWSEWSNCEKTAEGHLHHYVRRRQREVLNSQHPGGLPCNATVHTERCVAG